MNQLLSGVSRARPRAPEKPPGEKLRYAGELFESLYDPAKTKHFIERLERLQDGLGDINDVRVGAT